MITESIQFFLASLAASAECPRTLHDVVTDFKKDAADELVRRVSLFFCILLSCFAAKWTSPTDSFDIMSPSLKVSSALDQASGV